jgi:hypothetical protein
MSLETLPRDLLVLVLRYVPPVPDSETHLNTPDCIAHELTNKGRNDYRDVPVLVSGTNYYRPQLPEGAEPPPQEYVPGAPLEAGRVGLRQGLTLIHFSVNLGRLCH